MNDLQSKFVGDFLKQVDFNASKTHETISHFTNQESYDAINRTGKFRLFHILHQKDDNQEFTHALDLYEEYLQQKKTKFHQHIIDKIIGYARDEFDKDITLNAMNFFIGSFIIKKHLADEKLIKIKNKFGDKEIKVDSEKLNALNTNLCNPPHLSNIIFMKEKYNEEEKNNVFMHYTELVRKYSSLLNSYEKGYRANKFLNCKGDLSLGFFQCLTLIGLGLKHSQFDFENEIRVIFVRPQKSSTPHIHEYDSRPYIEINIENMS